MNMGWVVGVVLVLGLGLCEGVKVCNGTCQQGASDAIGMNKVMPFQEVQYSYCKLVGKCPTIFPAITGQHVNCQQGIVHAHDGYECNNVILRSYLSTLDLGSSHDGNDIWGTQLTDNQGRLRFLAIVGLEDGSSVVDVTDSLNPVVLGFLPSHECDTCTKVSSWRDMKVYGHYAFIVSENRGHGLQVLDLKRLINSPNPTTVPTLTEDAHYGQFGNCHNIALNVESGFAYNVGTGTCNGGLHIVDVRDPLNPTFAGCYSEDGYTHDTQCVNYAAPYPDARYHGHEICFNYNEDTLTIVDVTDKDNIVQLSRTSYHGFQYTHQGWLSEDGRFLYMDDELDEYYGTTYTDNDATVDLGSRTRTLVWNVDDLTAPYWVTSFHSPKTTIDHNLYIHNGLAYQSNYCAGLRVLNVRDPLNVQEVAYLDIAPDCDGPVFSGSWSNYPYYANHPDDVEGKTQIVAFTSIERGLYVVQVILS